MYIEGTLMSYENNTIKFHELWQLDLSSPTDKDKAVFKSPNTNFPTEAGPL